MDEVARPLVTMASFGALVIACPEFLAILPEFSGLCDVRLSGLIDDAHEDGSFVGSPSL